MSDGWNAMETSFKAALYDLGLLTGSIDELLKAHVSDERRAEIEFLLLQVKHRWTDEP